MNILRENLVRFLTIFTAVIILSGCVLLDPNYYIWHDGKNTVKDFMPWSGIDKHPISQKKTYFVGYGLSTIDYTSRYRWKMSAFDKRYSSEFANEIAKYLIKHNILQEWGFFLSRKGYIYGATPPYELNLISIKPSIVIMRKYTESELKRPKSELKSPNNTGALISDYFYRPVIYGTKSKYQSNLLFFSPDLDILPQPLNISKNSTTTIYWNKLFNSGAIKFTEKNGIIYTKRIANKEGKDFKKDGKYDPNHHLTLIDLKNEAQKK